MFWIQKDIEAEQLAVQSSNLTAAVLRLPERGKLVVLAYIEGHDVDALKHIITNRNETRQETRRRNGTRVHVVLGEDFNRYDRRPAIGRGWDQREQPGRGGSYH